MARILRILAQTLVEVAMEKGLEKMRGKWLDGVISSWGQHFPERVQALVIQEVLMVRRDGC